MALHSGAQYTAKQLAQSKLRFRKSNADPTFGGFKKRCRGIEFSFLMFMPLGMLEIEPVGTEFKQLSLSLSFALKSSQSGHTRPRAFLGIVLLIWLFASIPSRAETGTPIRIDASQQYSEPEAALYDTGSATSPSGSTLGLNSRYLTRDGKPWLPVMGEFHFSRYPRAQWEDEILKMKAAGVDIVATYVIWIHHEEIEGQFDWNGQRDLRAFTELCARHGMYVLPRIGPWDHAEVRNGGFPDWVIKQGPTRVNDPFYLASVRAWYGQIGQQLKGLLWKDGGPVLGIQLENEYSRRGPGAGEEHILKLKKIAIASGLDVPLYSITGWDNAVVPRRAVIPVYGGGYPDAPWDASIHKLPPPEVYDFRFHSRVTANASASQGADGRQPSAKDLLPYFTAEIGGGIEDTYHRRPVIQPDDIAAMFPVMLGSGVNLYGTYMFHGGENPEGKLSTLQESQETGYPNDLPIKSYDFQGPLGEFGQERASFRKLKVFQYFLNDFGSDLAPMTVHAPDALPINAADFTVPRASVRSRGDTGFIFFNNYVRNYSMPERRATQFQIHLPGGDLSVPRSPVDVPSGAYFIWPINLQIEGITLRYSTAQLFTRLRTAGGTTLYFEAIPGIPVEFAIDSASVHSVSASSGERGTGAGAIYLSGIKPGVESSIDLVSAAGKTVHLVVLTAEEAESAWKIRIRGEEHLLLTKQDFLWDPHAQPAHIWLRSRGTPNFGFTIMPPPAVPLQASQTLTRTVATDRLVTFTAGAKAMKPTLECHQIQAAGDAPPIKIGPAPDWRPTGVAQAPAASELPEAAKWSIVIPPGSMDGLSELFLQIKYQGDVARLSATQRLLIDDFYNGQDWQIGLGRFLNPQGASTFALSILPLRKDAPVYFENPKAPDFSSNGQIGKVDGMLLVPEYQLVIGAGSL
jgi:beta-galactosidase